MTMIEWFKNLDTWKKIVFSLAAVMVLAGIIVLIVIFIPKYTGPEENCVFLNEKANLHNEYYITVTDFSDRNTISILKNANDLEETSDLEGISYVVCCICKRQRRKEHGRIYCRAAFRKS